MSHLSVSILAWNNNFIFLKVMSFSSATVDFFVYCNFVAVNSLSKIGILLA